MIRAIACVVVVLVVILGLALVRRVDDDPMDAVSTSEPTPPTTWVETLPTLPNGFDPLKLTPTTTRPRLKARPASSVIPVGELQDMIRAGFARFGPDVADEAVHVAGCESTGDETGQRLDPGAVNGAHAGLFQLSKTYHLERAQRLGFTWEQMFEAGPNIAVAADLYGEKGKWSPTWTCAWAAAA